MYFQIQQMTRAISGLLLVVVCMCVAPNVLFNRLACHSSLLCQSVPGILEPTGGVLVLVSE